MLQVILDSLGLEPRRCAGLLGISHRVLERWLVGQERISPSYIPLLSDVLGVQPDLLQMTKRQANAQGISSVTPAVWYRFRRENVQDSDRECVVLIRQLGHFQNQLEDVTKSPQVGWKTVFETVRKETDLQAPPADQGRQAARIFRESTGLAHGHTGIAEVFRQHLRNTGVLVIESPLPKSNIDGCSFYVGSQHKERPCLFANNYESEWFHRNVTLMHELCHAVFDAATAGASLDFKDVAGGGSPEGAIPVADVAEERAEAFAQESLLPHRVLHSLCETHGIKPAHMSAGELAMLVAASGVEQRTVIKAGLAAQLFPAECAEKYRRLEIHEHLKELSERALSTEEFLERHPEKYNQLLLGKRTSTRIGRSIRLPVGYIQNVMEAVRDLTISPGKAAEFLMIDRETFARRFSEYLPAEAL